MSSLRDMRCGEAATVTRLSGEGALRRRIMDMGIIGGVRIEVRKVAPLGDPMEVRVRGYALTLRRADAAMILVENVERVAPAGRLRRAKRVNRAV